MEIEKDAQVDSSPTEVTEESQTLNTEVAQSASSTVDLSQASDPTQQQVAKEGAAEEKEGFVPKANVDGEVKRRLHEEMAPLIQQAVREALSGYQAQTNQRAPAQVATEEPKYKGYSKQQLETILTHPEATEQDKFFAVRGLGVLEAKEESIQTLKVEQEKTVAQSRQAIARQKIAQDYPSAVSPNGMLNYGDPVLQEAVREFQSEPRLQSLGDEGLLVALDRAYARMVRLGQIDIKKKETQVNLKEKQIEKQRSKAMSSTSTNVNQGSQKSDMQKTMDAWKKAPEGTREKAELQLKLFKMKGLIPPLG